MTESSMGRTPEPSSAPLTRRLLLRISGALGLTATGVAFAKAAGAETGSAATPDTPDEVGAFGRPPSSETLRRQRNRRARTTQSSVDASAATAAGPEAISAPGARLQPSKATIDSTPLSRRTSGTPWKVEG
jgi:hypothetical protein